MRKSIVLAGVVIAVVLAGTVSASAGVAAAGGPSASYGGFRGMVSSVNRQAHVFTLRDQRGRFMTVHVGAATRYERRGGFAAIRRGLRLDVRARRASGGWVATRVDWFNYGGGYGGSNQGWYHDDWDDDWSNGNYGGMMGGCGGCGCW